MGGVEVRVSIRASELKSRLSASGKPAAQTRHTLTWALARRISRLSSSSWRVMVYCASALTSVAACSCGATREQQAARRQCGSVLRASGCRELCADGSRLLHQPPHLQVWPLVVHHQREQLVLQALFCDAKVYERRLRRNLGLVVRVGQLGLLRCAAARRDGF